MVTLQIVDSCIFLLFVDLLLLIKFLKVDEAKLTGGTTIVLFSLLPSIYSAGCVLFDILELGLFYNGIGVCRVSCRIVRQGLKWCIIEKQFLFVLCHEIKY